MSNRADFLLARAGGRDVGLLLADVVEVADLGEIHRVPGTDPALRGVTWGRGLPMPVLHLGTLLAGGDCPRELSPLILVTELNGAPVCLEVDEVDVVSHGDLLPVPPGETMPWAIAVVRRENALVPILNLNALRDRLTEAGTRA